MKNMHLAAVVSIGFLFASAARADISTTGGWKAPAGVNMGEKKAISIALECKDVATFANKIKGGRAAIVAGPHSAPSDSKTHLTVRLYQGREHKKSCHVYMKGANYSGCSCEHTD